MKAKVINVIKETPDTKTIRFKLDSSFLFKPGQFVLLNADVLENGQKKFVKRAYSISSSPIIKDQIDLTVKIYPEKGLVSKRLYNMEVGEEIEMTGPHGFFLLDENIHKNIVLIAGGVGITPFISMLRYIKDKKLNDINVTLIYSSKTPEDIIFGKELLEEKYPENIKVHLTITRYNGNNWSGLTGRINEEMIKKVISEIKKPFYYICGPTIMVEETAKLLKLMGVEDSKIKLERFG